MSAVSGKRSAAAAAHAESPARFALAGDWWRWGVGAGLLVLLVSVVGPRVLVETFRRASFAWVLGVIALSLIWLALGALNVWLLLRRLAPVPLRTLLRVYVTSWATSLLLPGQLGDATLVLLLRPHGVPAASSSAAYLLDKMISLTWLVLVAAYGVGLYAPYIHGAWLPAALVAVILVAAASAAILRRSSVRGGGWAARAKGWVDALFEQLLAFRRYPWTVARNLALTILKWILMTLLYLGAFHAFGARIGLEAAATIPAMSSLVGYVPVTVGGAGTMEWTAVVLFKQVGIEAAAVLSVYLLLRGVLILGALLLLVTFRSGRRSEVTGADPR